MCVCVCVFAVFPHNGGFPFCFLKPQRRGALRHLEGTDVAMASGATGGIAKRAAPGSKLGTSAEGNELNAWPT